MGDMEKLIKKKDYQPRFRSRIYALCALYYYEVNPADKNKIIEDIKYFFPDKERVYSFFIELFEFTIKNIEKYDTIMKRYLVNWTIERMPIVEKNIIRMAISEFFNFDLINPVITINEALNLSHLFCNADSSKYINGILKSVGEEFMLLD